MRITINLEIPEDLPRSILTTCVEGGSAYWMQADLVVRTGELDVVKIVKPTDLEDGNPLGCGDIDEATVIKGIKKLFAGGLPNRHDLRAEILKGDDCDLDASDCDAILQLGIFGDVIYG